MRLLKCDKHADVRPPTQFTDDIPQYAILSHTWGLDSDEVTLSDLQDRSGKGKPGFTKIQFCADRATIDNLQYFWIDTCCIDKANHTELSEAITSMFRWYRDAAKCYVYLSDVSVPKHDEGAELKCANQPFGAVGGSPEGLRSKSYLRQDASSSSREKGSI
jgi:hypothetical protein